MQTKQKSRLAFTLVELLIVIAIIGVLATMITAASVAAMHYVRIGIVKMEMSQIELALESYNREFGEYPPDFFDDVALVRHFKKRWPRFPLTGANPPAIAAAIRTAIYDVYETIDGDIDYDDVKACQLGSLAFWLGGFPDKDGRFRGLGANPQDPFDVLGSDGKIDREKLDNQSFMELNLGKNIFLVDYGGGKKAFALVNNAGSGRFVPYVYFRGQSDGGPLAYYDNTPTPSIIKSITFVGYAEPDWPELGVAVPYGESGDYNATLANSTVVWNNPTTYQLIHPGLDGIFGVAGTNDYRSLNTADPFNKIGQRDMDNIVNFGDGTTIKSLLP